MRKTALIRPGGKTLQALIEHHDALRMVYREAREGIIQTYLPVTECKASFEIVDLYGTDEDMLKSQIQRLADHLQEVLIWRTARC